jgi:hypothetical protein
VTLGAVVGMVIPSILIGDMLRAGGHSAAASGYYGRAEGLLDAAC